MTTIQRSAIVCLGCLLAGIARGQSTPRKPPRPAASVAASPAAGRLEAYPTRYYVIHTDLSGDALREANLRMTRMAEEYHQRTRDFSGEIRSRLPFYLFSNPADYYATGAPPGSAGVFNGTKLMAVARPGAGAGTWHTVQHEGFHQFAHAVIRGDLPIWLNEGLAEYFGEGLWTGDGFVTGIIPPWRLKRIQESLRDRQMRSLEAMMQMSLEQWNGALSIQNYDQAWSMVHFLAHGDDGRYQKALAGFINAIARGQQWPAAWMDNFGSVDGFEEKWRAYWSSLQGSPTAGKYGQATVSILVSHLGRAQARKQTFSDFAAFVAAGRAGGLNFEGDHWLPASLLADAIKGAEHAGEWTLDPPAPQSPPRLTLVMRDQTRLIGSYTLRGGHVAEVKIDIDDLPVVITRAKALVEFDPKSRESARDLIRAAIGRAPRSPHLPAARAALAEMR